MLKAKAKNNKGTSDAGKTGDPRLSNYCIIIGYCGFYNKEVESRRERYGMVFCSSDCYSENWEKHKKECKCPESLRKTGYVFQGWEAVSPPSLERREPKEGDVTLKPREEV